MTVAKAKQKTHGSSAGTAYKVAGYLGLLFCTPIQILLELEEAFNSDCFLTCFVKDGKFMDFSFKENYFILKGEMKTLELCINLNNLSVHFFVC